MFSARPEAGAAGIAHEVLPPFLMRKGARPGFERFEIAPVLAHAHVQREEGRKDAPSPPACCRNGGVDAWPELEIDGDAVDFGWHGYIISRYNHHGIKMRTTLNIDDDVFELARGLADARRIPLGKALSALARRGAKARAPSISRSGFHTFALSEPAPTFGLAEVNAALESEGQELGDEFLAAMESGTDSGKR